MTPMIYALGFFDGVHLGHRALLDECKRLATEYGAKTAAITFDAHPQSCFSADVPPLLTDLPQRVELLKEAGMDRVLVLPATRETMATPWETFLAQLRSQGAAGFVCGHDFRFGCRGEGNAEKLSDYCRREGLPCTVVPEQLMGDVRISSSHIRALLAAGDVEEAARFLGRPYSITGQVVTGRRLGRTIGVPTANLRPDPGTVCPRLGVYASKVRVGEAVYLAVTNIGSRPTVEGRHVTVEPWILDFEGDLYGSTITAELHRFLRPEQKFPSLEELRQEIQKNALQTREFFKKV